MTPSERAARLLRIRDAEAKAAAAERDSIDSHCRQRAGLIGRLDALHACYQPATGETSSATLRGASFQRDRIILTRRDSAARLALLEADHAAAVEACREADRTRKSTEKLAERLRRDAAERRARRAESVPFPAKRR